MAFSTQAIKYGWLALASLGVITGTTIYVASNQRKQVKPQDIIEIAVGTHERCLATQYSTNPVSYYVSPPSFVRTWNRKYYEYGGFIINYTSYWPDATAHIICYTNYRSDAYAFPPAITYAESWTETGGYVWVTSYGHDNSVYGFYCWPFVFPLTENEGENVTNTIGWHIDRDMMISLDSTIKALVPYYCNTNTVYDGTTNIVMLTVTGLWASLGIGDKTNQFTREPCWTNTITTNWIVAYTNNQFSGGSWVYSGIIDITTNSDGSKNYEDQYDYSGGISNISISYTTAQNVAVWQVTDLTDSGEYGENTYLSTYDFGGTNKYYHYKKYRKYLMEGHYISNFPQIVQTITNAATYGDYPWQIYVEDLQERYKVLNALKMTLFMPVSTGTRWTSYGTGSTHGAAMSQAEATWNSNPSVSYVSDDPWAHYDVGIPNAMGIVLANDSPPYYQAWLARGWGIWKIANVSTQVSHFQPMAFAKGQNFGSEIDGQGDNITSNFMFQTYSQESDQREIYTFSVGSSSQPSWPSAFTNNSKGYWVRCLFNGGYGVESDGRRVIIDWDFLYCTNKYW